MLTNSDIVELTAVRHDLHRHPDLSGDEGRTAARIAEHLAALGPARLLTGLGGHGVAAVWDAPAPGPTVMFRAELDALPIHETGTVPHRSVLDGRGHLCGHDGHSTILLGLARMIARTPPARGRVVLLFQPAEETGAGATAVLSDPRFASIAPDWAFALHNMPGLPLGHVSAVAGPANCASEGMRLRFGGRTSHASMPEHGVSPARALAELMPLACAAGPGGALEPGFRLVSICHLRMGEPAFGITPGEAELWLTLRTLDDADMGALRDAIAGLAADLAARDGLSLRIETEDRFAACANHPEATAAILRAVAALGLEHGGEGLPMRASEDFGVFGRVARSAMFLLGSGTTGPQLHNPDYDFPDALLGRGVAIFDRIRRDLLG